MTSQFMDPVLNIAFKIWDSTSQVPGQEFSLALGKMPLHGNRSHCPWAQNFCSKARSGPNQSFHHKDFFPTTNSPENK